MKPSVGGRENWKILASSSFFRWVIPCLAYMHCVLSAVCHDTNIPPTVSLVWPNQPVLFGYGTLLKLKADASDPGGVAQVQFFANTNLIGIVTNRPFNIIWSVGYPGSQRTEVSVVAVDNVGNSNRSPSVRVVASEFRPPFAFIDIVSPCEGAMIAESAKFEFIAETLASPHFAGPLAFFDAGTSLLGFAGDPISFAADTAPVSISVSNLLEGVHQLHVLLRQGEFYAYGGSLLRTIRVVKLATHTPRLTPDGSSQFEVVTSYPNQPNIIEASLNLRDWTAISTNYPATNTFTYTDASPTADDRRFFRVRVPPP